MKLNKPFWFKTLCLILVLSLAVPMVAFASPSPSPSPNVIDYNRSAVYTAEEGNIARLPFMQQLTNTTEQRYNPLTGAGVNRTGINANFCNDSYGVPSVQVLRLIDGRRPASGTTNGYLAWSYTDTFGVNNRLYFVLNFGDFYTIDAVRCDWWTDNNVSVPSSEARVEWLDGDVWREVTNMRNPVTGLAVTNIGTLAMGNWNPVTFDPVTTTQLRLRLHRTGTVSNGIGVGEWEVFGVAGDPEPCADCDEWPCVCIPEITGIGAITGALRSGAVLTAGNVTFHKNPPTTGFAYQWFRVSDPELGGEAIPGATARTLTIAADDADCFFYVTVTGDGETVLGNATSAMAGPVRGPSTLVGIPGEFLSDWDILKQFGADSPHAQMLCTENAITLYDHGPDTEFGYIQTYAGDGKYVNDPFYEKGGFLFSPMYKGEFIIYEVAMDFEDCEGNVYTPYGLQSSVFTSGGAVYDMTYPQVIHQATFWGNDGLAGLPNHIFNGRGTASTAVPKAVVQRIEEMSMGRLKVTPVSLNGVYAALHPDIDELNDKWPWFRAEGPMLQYSTQGPADCEDYRQFTRIHQAGIDAGVRALEELYEDIKNNVYNLKIFKTAGETIVKDKAELLAEIKGAIDDIERIQLLYTVVPSSTHGYRSGLQGGSGLDTSFAFNDQSQLQRDSEFRVAPGLRTPGGRIIGSAIFGVKGITRSPASIINTWMHEFGHTIGMFDDYSYGSMGTNNGESTGAAPGNWGMMSGMNNTGTDLQAWRKYRVGWLEEQEVVVVLPGQTWEGYVRALGSFEGDGRMGVSPNGYTDDPTIVTRMVVIPTQMRTRDTFGLLGVWANGWNNQRTAYQWYNWFTNPFVGGETHAIKTFPTFYTLESRKTMGLDNNLPTANQGINVCYVANSTWETGHGAGGFKHMVGNNGLRVGGTTTYQDQNIGLTVTVLESGAFYDRVRVTYAAVPQRAAARQVFLGSLTASDSYVTAEETFTVDFDIMSFGGPNTADATAAPAAPTRVGTPVGVKGGVAGFEMIVEFDAANLEYVSVGNAPFSYVVNDTWASHGRLLVAGAGNKSINRDTILSLNFKAKDDAALGTYTVSGTITDVALHNWRGEVVMVGGPGFNGTANGSAVGTIGAGTFGAFHSPNTLNLSSEDIRSTGGRVFVGAEETFVVSGRVVCDTPGPAPGTFTGVESVVTLFDSAGQTVGSTKSDYKGYYSIDGVPAGEGYYITANKPKYAIGTSAPFGVDGDTKVTGLAPLSRQRFTVSGVVYGMAGSEGFINNNSAANSTTIWPVNPVAVPLAGVDVYLINTGDAFSVIGGPVKTDENGRYTVTGWEVGRNFAAVAVSVKGTEYEDLYLPQLNLCPTLHQPQAGVTEWLELLVGAKFGDNPADINFPSGTGAMGATRNNTSGLFNIFCFSLDRNYNNLHVVLTETQDVRIRMTTKSNQIFYQLYDMNDNPVGAPSQSRGNANGDDVIRNVPPGDYYIVASRTGYVSAATTPFTVTGSRIIFRNNVTTNYMDLVTTANGQTIAGTLLCAVTGEPLAGVRVQSLPHSTGQGASVPVYTAEDGTFRVTTVSGVRDLMITGDGIVDQYVRLATGNISNRTIELTPEHIVEFLDWDGTLIAERIVAHGEAARAPADPTRKDWVFTGWDLEFSEILGRMVVTAQYDPTVIKLGVDAFVTKLNGNQNDLTITVTETWSSGVVRPIKTTLKINNNAAGTYSVGIYRVYVDTKGNDQIRELRIVEVVGEPSVPSSVEDVALIRVSTNAKDITISGSNVWTVSFKVTETYSDGNVEVVAHSVQVNKNSSGRANLGSYTLIYDIAGNGSNIKDFRVVLN